MVAGIKVSLQREIIQGPMAAVSPPYLQRRKNNYSMMAVPIIVLQQDKVYSVMTATGGFT